jgi:hypothetical protein
VPRCLLQGTWRRQIFTSNFATSVLFKGLQLMANHVTSALVEK